MHRSAVAATAVLALTLAGPRDALAQDGTATVRAPDTLPSQGDPITARERMQELAELERAMRALPESGSRGDGLMHMTADTAKFFLALGAVQYYEAMKSDDPLVWDAYLKSLAEPATYFSYYLFVQAAGGTHYLADRITKGRYKPRYLGLAAASLTLDFFYDFLYSPSYAKLKTAKDPEERARLRRALFGEMFLSGERWQERALGVVGLVGAAGTLNFIHRGVEYSARRVGARFVVEGAEEVGTRAATTGVRSWMGKYVANKGLRIVWKGRRVLRLNPYLFVAGELVDTAAFLVIAQKYHEVLEPAYKGARAYWDGVRGARGGVDQAVGDYLGGRTDLAAVQRALDALDEAEGAYRRELMSPVMRKYYIWQDELGRRDMAAYQRGQWYTWMGRGGRLDDPVFVQNEFDWHRDPASDPAHFGAERESWRRRFLYTDKVIDAPRILFDTVRRGGSTTDAHREIGRRLRDGQSERAALDLLDRRMREEDVARRAQVDQYRTMIIPKLREVIYDTGRAQLTGNTMADGLGATFDDQLGYYAGLGRSVMARAGRPERGVVQALDAASRANQVAEAYARGAGLAALVRRDLAGNPIGFETGLARRAIESARGPVPGLGAREQALADLLSGRMDRLLGEKEEWTGLGNYLFE
ncbi:MAG: hypothetical protein HY722_16460 [Planctomycetes bacterium]|nr:hypothetical protein [Planctomycetota bacterium]